MAALRRAVAAVASFAIAFGAAALVIACAPEVARPVARPRPVLVPTVRIASDSAGCPKDMALAAGTFCIDRYEASLVEIAGDGRESPFPWNVSPEGKSVRAVSVSGAYPQGYISGKDADRACRASGKRLCDPREWVTACKGPKKTTYPYGEARRRGACNDHGKNPRQILGIRASTWNAMNLPALNAVEGTLSKTGEHDTCVNEWGVYDMVGNLHEWVADPKGTFQGGYYLDTHENGEGCDYRTTAHVMSYHDYSTGFRCCRDLEAEE
jgi:formylglycine-generating enzyme required for sulfatase activity